MGKVVDNPMIFPKEMVIRSQFYPEDRKINGRNDDIPTPIDTNLWQCSVHFNGRNSLVIPPFSS